METHATTQRGSLMTMQEDILAVVEKGPTTIHELEAHGLERSPELQEAMRDLVRDNTIEGRVDVANVKVVYTKVA